MKFLKENRRLGDIVTPACAIVGIVIIEITALALGYNGHLQVVAIGAISGIAGFTIRPLFDTKRRD